MKCPKCDKPLTGFRFGRENTIKLCKHISDHFQIRMLEAKKIIDDNPKLVQITYTGYCEKCTETIETWYPLPEYLKIKRYIVFGAQENSTLVPTVYRQRTIQITGDTNDEHIFLEITDDNEHKTRYMFERHKFGHLANGQEVIAHLA